MLRFAFLKEVSWVSLVAQTVKHLPAMQETRVQFLGQEDHLEKEMAIHSSTLAWKTPWTEEPDRLQSMGSQRDTHDWATSLSLSLKNSGAGGPASHTSGFLIRLVRKIPWASLVAQAVKNLPAMQKTWVRSPGWEDPLEESMAIHFSILAWRIPMDREARRGTVHRVTKVEHDLVTKAIPPSVY